MAEGLSEQSLAEWARFAESVASDSSSPLDRDLLNRFLIAVHMRGEELAAHQLKAMVDDLHLDPALAKELIDFIGPALALLEAYDPADGDDDDGIRDVGPGVLVL